MAKKSLNHLNVKGKTVLLRVDFNVPMERGIITDDNRIRQAIPTFENLIKRQAKIVCFSHLGRIKTIEDKRANSLAPVAIRLQELLKQEVVFVHETRGKNLESAIKALKPGGIVMFENTRYEDLDYNKESLNDQELGKYWASLGDLFVNDAFGTAHRAHASNVGIASNIKESAAGLLLDKEITMLGEAIHHPKRPLIAILGGIKVSDKIGVIRNLLKQADQVLIGGGMSYTFLKAQGYEVGTSVLEKDKLDLAKILLEEGKGKMVLPVDFKVTQKFDNDAPIRIASFDDFKKNEMGLDIGPKTLEKYQNILKSAKTVIWNGPLGVFEMSNFSHGTIGICETLASLKDVTTVIGGGDSASAAINFGFEHSFTHISTGGGASLEFIEGKNLPGVACLDEI